jgi:tight adherence protein B
MLEMQPAAILRAGLAVVVVCGVFFGFVSPWLNGEGKAEKRKKALQGARRGAERVADPNQRRKQVADTLKELEARSKGARLNLEQKLAQTGMRITKSKFWIGSAVSAVVLAFIVLVVSQSPLFALIGLGIGALGPPNWFVSFRRKRRKTKFIDEFPNAVDIIVRGVKAGLPLNDCLRVIATEAAEPVKSEFRQVVEHQAIGLSIAEAVEKIAERVPTPEANFFVIAIGIQQKAGGNLSETLSNLSKVLRDRKKMKQKIRAMSSEARASAGIIGSLPFLVTFFVYLSSPAYITLLWTTPIGRVVLLVCGLWMATGVFVMKKMVNFDI